MDNISATAPRSVAKPPGKTETQREREKMSEVCSCVVPTIFATGLKARGGAQQTMINTPAKPITKVSYS